MVKLSNALAKSKKLPDSSNPIFEESKKPAESGIIKNDCTSTGAEYENGAGVLDKDLVTHLDPHSFIAEQFKSLRTDILFPASGDPPRTIMMTSVAPGEGKSFVAANLAISIAQNVDEHVLLMDCDLRKPCIHSLFGFNGVPGLSDYLDKGIPLESLLQKTCINKLTILPGGQAVTNPVEVLSSKKMTGLLEEVKSRYPDRYIIIDTPPPQLTSETKALARQVDGIFLVIKYGSTRLELIEDLVDKLGKERIIGAVINHFNMRSSKYGHGYGKSNYYYGKHE